MPRRGLRRVANRRGDRHEADAPRGDCDDDEREEDADRIRDRETPPAHREADVEALGSEGLGHREHHPVGDRCAEERADKRGEEVVRNALERERLDEVPAPRADCAGDSELAATLGGEHHEDEKDEQDPGSDREGAERGEEGHERAARDVRGLEDVLLHRRRLGSVGLVDRGQRCGHLVGEGDARRDSATVRNDHAVDLALAAEEALRLGQREERGRPVATRAAEVNDVPDPHAHGFTLRVHEQGVAGRDVELFRSLLRDVRLTRAKLGERCLAALDLADGLEAVHARGICCEDPDARLGAATNRGLGGDLVDDRRRHAVDETGSGERFVHGVDNGGIKVGAPRRVPELARDVVRGALRRHDLVDRAHRLHGLDAGSSGSSCRRS